MRSRLKPEDVMPAQHSAGWQRMADRLTRYVWRVLLVAVVIGLIGGVIVAAAGPSQPVERPVQPTAECAQPPCWGLDLENVGLADIPAVLWLPVYLLALALSLPGVLAGLWDAGRRRWCNSGRRLLPFVSLLLFFMGTEVIPHVLLPCAALPGMCEDLPGRGRDIAGSWHLLHHMLIGAVPMAVLLWLAFRTWRPDVLRRGM